MEIIEICVIYIAAVVTIIAFRQREKQSGGGIGISIIYLMRYEVDSVSVPVLTTKKYRNGKLHRSYFR